MRFFAITLDPDSLGRCRALWGDRSLYQSHELDAALDFWRLQLASNRARGAVLVDERERPRYFGLTTFVVPAVAEQIARCPRPRIGAALATRAWGDDSILTERQIADGNSGAGLSMVVVNQGWDLDGPFDEGWPSLMGALLKEFEDVHAGFRLSMILGEAFGADGVNIVRSSGAYPNLCELESTLSSGSTLPSILFWLTREEAIRGWSTLLPMFSYTEPRVFFTPLEQRLLREALRGATDRELASRLRTTVPAIKSSWTRVFTRVSDRVPDVVGVPSRTSSHRGEQWRHVLIEYVRRHPSELTPFSRSSHSADVEPRRHSGQQRDSR